MSYKTQPRMNVARALLADDDKTYKWEKKLSDMSNGKGRNLTETAEIVNARNYDEVFILWRTCNWNFNDRW